MVILKMAKQEASVENRNSLALVPVSDSQVLLQKIGNDGTTPAIVTAAGELNLSKILSLLDQGADVNEASSTGMTALHASALAGHERNVRLLLRRGANNLPNATDKMTPLHYAGREGNLRILAVITKKLCRDGGDLNVTDGKGFTPLMLAVEGGHLKAVKLLLMRGALPFLASKHSFQPIHSAAYNGHASIITLLLDAGASIDATTSLATYWRAIDVAGYRDAAPVGQLGELGQFGLHNDMVRSVTPLHLATLKNHKEAVQVLLERGATLVVKTNPYMFGASPLSTLSYALRSEDVLPLLLQAGNVNDNEDLLTGLLLESAAKGIPFAIKAIAGKIGNVNRSFGGTTAMHQAVWNKSYDVSESTKVEAVGCLLDLGASAAGTPNEDGDFPVHVAYRMGFQRIIRMFLDREPSIVDLHAQDRSGRKDTPLIIACRNGSLSMVKILLERGANVLQTGDGGKHLLQILIHSSYKHSLSSAKTEEIQSVLKFKEQDFKRRLSIVETLIARNDSLVNKTSPEYLRTPLETAVEKAWFDMVELLILLGADVKENGDALLKAVYDVGSYPIADILLKNGANPNLIDTKGESLMQKAIKTGSFKMVELLLKYNAEILHIDDARQTPLHLAASSNNIKLVRIFLETLSKIPTIDISSKLEKCWVDCDTAVTLQNNPKKAFIDMKDSEGWTALHFAANSGYADAVKELLSHGADPTIETAGLITPRLLASVGAFTNIYEQLLEAERSVKEEDDLELAKIKGIPFSARENSNAKHQETLADLKEFTNQSIVLTSHACMSLSTLAQKYPKFNDEVEHKAWVPTTWKKDGFLSISDDLEVLALDKCILSLAKGNDNVSDLFMGLNCKGNYCKQPEECAKTRALLRECIYIQKHLQHPQCEFSCLKPRLNVVGSMTEGTRLGGADEMDLPLTFEALAEYPMTLSDGSLTANISSPDKIKFLGQFKNELGGFSYTQFLERLCSEIKTCLTYRIVDFKLLDRKSNDPDWKPCPHCPKANTKKRLHKELCSSCFPELDCLSEYNRLSVDLSCNVNWKPCPKCPKSDNVNLRAMGHCKTCLPAVTYTKLGVCLIFQYKDWWGGNRVLTLDLIPNFEIMYNGTDTSLSQKVFATLHDIKPEGWSRHCDQISRRDRMIIDASIRASVFGESKVRQEKMALKLLNDYNEGVNYIIRPFFKTKNSRDGVTPEWTPEKRKHYIIIKAIAKVFGLDVSSYLIKKQLFSYYDESARTTSSDSVPKSSGSLDTPLPCILMAMNIRPMIENLIDLQQWKADILSSSDPILSNYIPIKIQHDGDTEKHIERCYRDYHLSSILNPGRKIVASEHAVKEGDILEAAHYFMTRRPKEIDKAIHVLSALLRRMRGFHDWKGVVELLLTVVDTFGSHSQLVCKALDLLQSVMECEEASSALDYARIEAALERSLAQSEECVVGVVALEKLTRCIAGCSKHTSK